ncbi:hypothetical protein KIN20_009958 [Parelaphostrongylus tenuis]|uniref:Uncharacterized protein n=1 Tax=Parelaphostrongylus tenuis TaxID=148309 RepID=A0AAD5MAH1_PARTN|nr:hypothetical protein KIN20_009958 [Parelaphostrongylus tenuis]
MAYAGKREISTQTPGISASRDRAQAFVQRLVMQTVYDVLERHGRSAPLPDAVISAILSQLTLNIDYEPLRYETIIKSSMNNANPYFVIVQLMHPSCIIIGNTVTRICTTKADKDKCHGQHGNSCSRQPHINIGTFSATNIIMALVENDVAKCSEESGSNVGIGTVWIALLLDICYRRRKTETQLPSSLLCSRMDFGDVNMTGLNRSYPDDHSSA